MFVWLLHFKGFFLYALLFYMKNVGCGPLFMSVHPNIYYRTFVFQCSILSRMKFLRIVATLDISSESMYVIPTFHVVFKSLST